MVSETVLLISGKKGEVPYVIWFPDVSTLSKQSQTPIQYRVVGLYTHVSPTYQWSFSLFNDDRPT